MLIRFLVTLTIASGLLFAAGCKEECHEGDCHPEELDAGESDAGGENDAGGGDVDGG
jgi:hypothetical protein